MCLIDCCFKITIVGRIINKSKTTASTQYTVEDETGKMDVNIWSVVDNNSGNERSLRVNDYVRCIGTIHMVNDSSSFNVFKICEINDKDEIEYHRLECIYAQLMKTNPKQAFAVSRNFNLNDNKKKKCDLETSILQFLRDHQSENGTNHVYDGCSVECICNALNNTESDAIW